MHGRTGLARTHGGALLSTFLIHSGTLICMDTAGTVVSAAYDGAYGNKTVVFE